MPRQARIDYPGALHHVIARGIEGKDVFKEEYDKKELYTRLKELLEKSNVQIYAWSIMSNHFHIVIQTGRTTLSQFMRQLLTGYAVNYNKRHKRKGYLFQNRYKSIVCDKDEYLLPLIRYVHLNPVKAKMSTFSQLKKYKWTGHKEIMGVAEKGLIEKDEVLGFFGKTEGKGKAAYEEFVKDGTQIKDDFMGGGLIRSSGGLDKVLQMGKDKGQSYDERILGSGEFVEDVLGRLEAEDSTKKLFKNIDDLLERVSLYYKIEKSEIINTNTIRVRDARNIFVYLACDVLRCTATEAGRVLKITQSSASRYRKKGQAIEKEQGILKRLSKIKNA